MWWPAIGGLAVGIGGLVEPRVLGVGYGVLTNGKYFAVGAISTSHPCFPCMCQAFH
jgi:H+/Cl- antiporter ClcA